MCSYMYMQSFSLYALDLICNYCKFNVHVGGLGWD